MGKRKLIRTNINITEEEYTLLLEETEKIGMSMSEIIRRAIDGYFEKVKNLFLDKEQK